MCGSMVDIQSPTAEIRRGENQEERRRKKQDKKIMSASAMKGGHNQCGMLTDSTDGTTYCPKY